MSLLKGIQTNYDARVRNTQIIHGFTAKCVRVRIDKLNDFVFDVVIVVVLMFFFFSGTDSFLDRMYLGYVSNTNTNIEMQCKENTKFKFSFSFHFRIKQINLSTPILKCTCTHKSFFTFDAICV